MSPAKKRQKVKHSIRIKKKKREIQLSNGINKIISERKTITNTHTGQKKKGTHKSFS
jgi:hypothetical protein